MLTTAIHERTGIQRLKTMIYAYPPSTAPWKTPCANAMTAASVC